MWTTIWFTSAVLLFFYGSFITLAFIGAMDRVKTLESLLMKKNREDFKKYEEEHNEDHTFTA